MQTPEEHAEWLEERRKGIGASEVGILFGVSPYGSKLSLWAEKTGRETAPRSEQSLIAMRVGNELEAFVLKLAAEETGFIFRPNTRSLALGEKGIVRATPDAFVTDPARESHDYGIADAKVVGQHNMAEWLDGLVPLDYQLQLQQQMVVLGCTWGIIAGLLLGSSKKSLVCKRIEYDPELGALIVEQIETFWRDHVEADVAPEADDHKATTAVLKVLHPSDNGMLIKLGRPLEHARKDLVEAKAEEKALKKRIALRENQLRLALADATYGEFPDGTGISLKTQRTAHGGTARYLRMMKPKAVTAARKDSDLRIEEMMKAYR